jgi:hypothetical protein
VAGGADFGMAMAPPTLIRWLEASALFGVALAVRVSLGPLYGAIPFLSFYPAILLAAVRLGWKEAILSSCCHCQPGGISSCLPVCRCYPQVGRSSVRRNPEHCNHYCIESLDTGAC